MASATKMKKNIRKAKKTKQGAKKKAQRRNHGTTKSAADLFGDN